MKIISVVVVLLAALSCSVWAAVPYTLTVGQAGGNWTYHLTVSGAPQNVEGLYLYWDVTNSTNNHAQQLANFNSLTGYVSTSVVGWLPAVGGDEPAWAGGAISGASSSGDFTVTYTGASRPSYFRVFWTVNAGLPNEDWVGSSAMGITGVPEPGAIVSLLTGLVGLGGLVTRRRK